jgi:hypothetical protein
MEVRFRSEGAAEMERKAVSIRPSYPSASFRLGKRKGRPEPPLAAAPVRRASVVDPDRPRPDHVAVAICP